MDNYLKMIGQYLDDIPLTKEPRNLYEPVAYCLANGGKRIRPVMTLLACKMFGGNLKEALPAAAGLELFHNFTLLHDDIMDDAPIRRNKPTVHEQWNANTAILSGDVLFAISSQHVSKVPDAHLRPVLDLFYQTVTEVCEGQQYDMDFENRHDVSEEEYLEMIRLKTAVLPAACLKTGAIVAGAPAADQELVYRFGELIGLAFQLRDDWLDVYGDLEAFGKKTGGDIVANKKTWLYIKALDKADKQQQENLIKAFSDESLEDDEKIRLVTSVYDELNISDDAQQKMKEYYALASVKMDRIDLPGEQKSELIAYADQLLNRNK